QFLADPTISGFALAGGGTWTPPATGDLAATSRRLYTLTGYRDYMMQNRRAMLALLVDHHFPADRLWIREANVGHHLFGWMYEDMWPFLTQGLRPAVGALQPGWHRASFSDRESLLAIFRRPDGAMIATGAAGGVWLREGTGAWRKVAALDPSFAPAW